VTDGDGPRWVRRALQGDESAFRWLYDAHVDRAFRLAYRITGDEELARDATQEAFIRAFDGLEGYRADGAFSTWLHRITVRASLNLIRDGARHGTGRIPLEDGVSAVAAGSRDTPGLAPHFELRDRLREAVDSLPEKYRIVLLMHDVEGFAHREIAEALEVREGTSKARLSRARARLREILDEELLEYVR
jgi:RNA polymerase sigma-70 factor, ECF subfamily